MRFLLRNREGTPVDPVPFLVTSLLAVPILIGCGPLYLLELGVPLGPAVSLSVILCAGVGVAAYHRCVLTARPELRSELPVALRVRRLLYTVAVIGALLLGVTAVVAVV